MQSLFWFKKDKKDNIQILINLRNKVNIILFVYTFKLGFANKLTKIRVQKIDILLLQTYKIVIAGFKF